MSLRRTLTVVALLLSALIAAGAARAEPSEASPYAQWKNGPPKDDSYFPVGVWMQEPSSAPEYQKAGINLYIDLWQGPTEEQLAQLKEHGMPVVCRQNAVGLAHKDDPIIVGWLDDSEPDEVAPFAGRRGQRLPVPPAEAVKRDEAIRKADPSRPLILEFGQGAAWDGWESRGERINHPEDYREYLKGCDITFFEFFPVADPYPEVRGKLDYMARGVERLVKSSDGRKPVWNFIECTKVRWDAKATPRQIKAEVWMSLVYGSRGIIYFVHEFPPNKATDRALLNDPENLAAVTSINKQIRELAPALNSPSFVDALKVTSSNQAVPVATMVKKQGGAIYVFAVAMKPGATEAAFTLRDSPVGAQVEVLGENRKLEQSDGTFRDRFEDWDVHLYRVH